MAGPRVVVDESKEYTFATTGRNMFGPIQLPACDRVGIHKSFDKTLEVSSSAPTGQPSRRGRSAVATRPLASVPSLANVFFRAH